MARTKIDEYEIEKLNSDRGLTIMEIDKLFSSAFPDSFGFKVYKPKKGTRVFDLQPDYDSDGFYGVNDDDLRLSFDKFHSLNYKVHQGDENTYFYFVLDGNDNDSYIGSFGFKDRGDVPKEYVTEFIAFLHKIYNFPFKVSHEVYNNGGEIDYYDFDKKMALINLNQIHEYSVKLDKIVSEETQLEEWVKMKLTRIEQNVADVKKSLEGWEKFQEFGDGGRIFKKQLLHISKYANDLIDMIKSGSKLMSWQENKLAVSAEYIDGIYHHLDYKMGNRASNINFDNGGGVDSIPNNYEGKSPKDIWASWSKEQRKHFLYDHKSDARDSDEVGDSKGYYYSYDIDEWVEMEWNELPLWIKNLVFEHTDNGQYANGGGVDEFYEGQSIIMRDTFPYYDRMTKEMKKRVSPYYNKELVIEKIINNKPHNSARAFVRSSGEKVPFEITLNKKYIEQYANGGGVDGFNALDLPVKYKLYDEKGNIIHTTTSFNTASDKSVMENLKVIATDKSGNSRVIREIKYAEGGSINSEISKSELEQMVGRKLNGWNDDVVYQNGKTYKKCFLKPYYKTI